MKIFRHSHPHLFGIIYGGVLTAFTVYALLDTFVIPRTYTVVSQTAASTGSSGTYASAAAKSSSSGSTSASGSSAASGSTSATVSPAASGSTSATGSSAASGSASATGSSAVSGSASAAGSPAASGAATVTDTSYSDRNITITITTYRENDTNIYVADVQLASLDSLKAAFASNTYGKNVTATTSAIADSVNAILAINGDFYGAQETGYVIRNGVLYRSTSAGSGQEDLVIYNDGTFGIIDEGETTAEELINSGAWQVLSFGPALVENGQVSVSSNEEVGKAMASNPRTAIGIIDSLHYVFVVSDGRTSASTGLSLSELASFMTGLGVTCAYNLDGGGSSTMVFNGTVVNQPTTNGNTISERKVSDIVYIG